ncbi:MAG: 5'/3'-nucleotidase SurE [Bacillota bacterium]
MKILVANDDGITSKGLYSLACNMKDLGKVFVVAPESNQSAIGHAITMHDPLRSKRVDYFGADIDAWWVNGTPADCIKLGIESLMKEKPDLIVSGINRGENLGTDVLYSGTVSAAIEGCIFGVPSIAFSYEDFSAESFEAAGQIAAKIAEAAYKNGISENTVLNVNIPRFNSLEEIKGIKITKLGVKIYKNNFEERLDPRGNTYYWLTGELQESEIEENTDIEAIRNKYVSVTPIKIDLTDYEIIEKLKQWNLSIY